MVELSLSIACVCFPAIWQLLKKYFPAMFSLGSSKGNSNTNVMLSLNVLPTPSDQIASTSSAGIKEKKEKKDLKSRSIGSRLLKRFDELWMFDNRDSESMTAIRSEETERDSRRDENGGKASRGEEEKAIRKQTSSVAVRRADTMEKAGSDRTIDSAVR
jgi:hypothetical protein